MSVPVVKDLREPPVVGCDYLVPCVRYWWYGRLRWWPVIGPKHDDAEHLDFEAVHYHLDRRFLPAHMFTREGWGDRSRRGIERGNHLAARSADSNIAAAPISEFGHGTARPNGYGPGERGGPLPAPVLRKRRCIVSDVGFPGLPDKGVLKTFDRLHAAYEGRRCGRDSEGRLICPHKGALLDSLAPDAQGRVTCPLHGLMINVKSGVVIRRPRVGGSRVR